MDYPQSLPPNFRAGAFAFPDTMSNRQFALSAAQSLLSTATLGGLQVSGGVRAVDSASTAKAFWESPRSHALA